jgi:uncharacterized protein YciI
MMISVLLLTLTMQATPANPPSQAATEPTPRMMTYQMVFLRKGPAPEPQGAEAEKAQAEHLAHLARLNRERKNLLYGPFTDGGDPVGVAVFDVPDSEAARALMSEDPHVKAGALTVDVKPWLGPKGQFDIPPTTDVMQQNALEQLVFGILMSGPNRSQPKAEAEELQKRHLAYMADLHAQGKLILAGPFMDDGAWRGIVVYRVAGVDEAKQLAAGDPMVKAGRLAIEARPWMTLRGILR